MDKGIKQIAEHYGFKSQSLQLIEELSELTVAISHLNRALDCGDDLKIELALEDVTEELADVKIMVLQIEHLLDCKKEVTEIAKQKIERQLERIEREC